MKIMTWAYKVLPINQHYSVQAVSEKLNAWGDNGWELVQITPQYVVFKKPTGYLKDKIDMVG
jgi:hypothetical protein